MVNPNKWRLSDWLLADTIAVCIILRWRGSSRRPNYLPDRSSEPFSPSCLRELVLLPLSQQEFASLWRQLERELVDLSFQWQAQDEFLLRLPSSKPLVSGIEEDPSAGFGISAVEVSFAQAVLAEELDQFADGFLIILQARFASLLLFGMLFDDALGFVIERVGVGLNLLRVVVRVKRCLHHFEVFHELQRDCACAYVHAVISAVANGQQNSEDGFDAMVDD